MVPFETMVLIAFLAAFCGLALGVFFICIVLRYFYVESEGIVSVRLGRTEEKGAFRYARVKSPSIFCGTARTFREWVFQVDTALKSYKMNDGVSQVEFAASFLEGNALLWYLSCIDFGRSFSDWNSLKNALGEAFGPFNADEQYRLALFSLSQNGTLDAYTEEFTRLSLSVVDLDQLSRAMLFTRGLSEGLRSDAIREHPRDLSEAIRAARMAERNITVNDRDTNRERRFLGKTDVAKPVSKRQRPTERRPKLSEEERTMLMRQGRCFKCRGLGHLAKDCQRKTPAAKTALDRHRTLRSSKDNEVEANQDSEPEISNLRVNDTDSA